MPGRLAKPYSGDAYGFHFPLIQGTEVAIAFEEGDPDRPYIAHALHDSRHVDHVTDKNGTRNVIRTMNLITVGLMPFWLYSIIVFSVLKRVFCSGGLMWR